MAPVLLGTRPKSKNVEITNPKTWPRPMKFYKNYLINCRGLAKFPFRFHGKTPNGVIGEKKEFILLGDLNCDLLSETISKSKHPVHYITHGLTQVIKEAIRTTAETNTLTYYIVTNKRIILLTLALFLVALVIMALFILSDMPGFLKLIRIQKLSQSEAPKT